MPLRHREQRVPRPPPAAAATAAIVPAAKAVKGKPGDYVDNAVRENAKRTAAKIVKESEIVSELIHHGKVKVVYARYDLNTGAVLFLS